MNIVSAPGLSLPEFSRFILYTAISGRNVIGFTTNPRYVSAMTSCIEEDLSMVWRFLPYDKPYDSKTSFDLRDRGWIRFYSSKLTTLGCAVVHPDVVCVYRSSEFSKEDLEEIKLFPAGNDPLLVLA